MANNRRQDDGQALVLHKALLPMPAVAPEFGIDEHKWKALAEAVWPAAKTVDGIMLGVQYCHARGLDPFKRPVHIVPMYNSKLGREVETVWPGIGELRTTASRTGVWAGNDDCQFGPVRKRAFKATRRGQGRSGEPYENNASCDELTFPEWAQFTVYKIVAGHRVPFVGPKVRFEETFSGQKGLRVPNEKWQMSPYQMLEKCAEAAALRRAFPEEIGNELTADEMEGQVIRQDMPQATAKYHFVSAEEADGGDGKNEVVDAEIVEEEDDGPTREEKQQRDERQQQQPAADRDLNGWNERRLERYMETMKAFLEDATDIETIDHAITVDADKLDSLPKRENDLAQGYIAAARKRLLGGGEQQREEPKQQEREQSSGEQRQQAPADPGDAEDPPFVRNFRRRVAEVELIADLIELEKNEQRAIDQQPGWVGKICARIIETRTAELRGGKGGDA